MKKYWIYLIVMLIAFISACESRENKNEKGLEEKENQFVDEKATALPQLRISSHRTEINKPFSFILKNKGDNVSEGGCRVFNNNKNAPNAEIKSVIYKGKRTCEIFGVATDFTGRAQYSIQGENIIGGNSTVLLIQFESNEPLPRLQLKSSRYPLESQLHEVLLNEGGSVKRCEISSSSPIGGPQLQIKVVDQTVDTCMIFGDLKGKIERYYYTVNGFNDKGSSNAIFELFLRKKAPKLQNAFINIQFNSNFNVILINEGGRIDQCTISHLDGSPVENISVKVHSVQNKNTCLVSGSLSQLEEITKYQVQASNIYHDTTKSLFTVVPPGACQIDEIEYEQITINKQQNVVVSPKNGPYGCKKIKYSIRKKQFLQVKNATEKIINLPKPDQIVKIDDQGRIQISSHAVSMRETGEYLVSIQSQKGQSNITHDTLFKFELEPTNVANFRQFNPKTKKYQSADKHISLQVQEFSQEDIQHYNKKHRVSTVQGSDLALLLNRKRNNKARVSLNQANLFYQISFDTKLQQGAPNSLLNISSNKNCMIYLPLVEQKQSDNFSLKLLHNRKLQMTYKKSDNEIYNVRFFIETRRKGQCLTIQAAGKKAAIVIDNLQFTQ